MWNLPFSEDGKFLGNEREKKGRRILEEIYIFAIKSTEKHATVLGQPLFAQNNIHRKTPNWGTQTSQSLEFQFLCLLISHQNEENTLAAGNSPDRGVSATIRENRQLC